MSQNKPKNSISSSVHEIWCCFHEYGAALLTPTTSSGSTPASPLSSPLLGEPWLGQCRWKGPPLRATALTACEGPAWVSQAQPYQPRSSSPSLQKLWCRQYVHTYTCTHGQCIPSRALRSPSQPLSQTSAAGEVKTPSRIKEEKQQEEGGRDRGMGRKKDGKSISSCSLAMSASPSIPHAAVIGKVRRGNSGTPYGQQREGRVERQFSGER